MALVVLVSAKGAPGVTTLTVALAALTPGAVAADLDPDGGDLGLRYRRPDGAPLDAELGLLSLVAGLRRDLPGQRWLPPAEGGALPEGPTRLEDHLQVTGGGLDLLLGVTGPEQATGLGPLWSPLARALSEAGRTVYADCGRVGPAAPTMPVLHQADAVIVVARPELEELAHLRERLRFLNSAVPGRFAGRAQIGVVLVAPERDRAVAGRTEQLLHSSGVGVPVLGTMALDQRGAEALRGMNRSRLTRSTLIRSVRSLLPSVSLLAGTIPELTNPAPVLRSAAAAKPPAAPVTPKPPVTPVRPPAEEEPVDLFAEARGKVTGPPSVPSLPTVLPTSASAPSVSSKAASPAADPWHTPDPAATPASGPTAAPTAWRRLGHAAQADATPAPEAARVGDVPLPGVAAAAPGSSVPGTQVSGVQVSGASVPRASVPRASVPGASVPGAWGSGPSVPGASVPGASVAGHAAAPDSGTQVSWAGAPGASVPEAFLSGDSVPGESVPGSWGSGASVPGASVPGASVPGASVPGASVPGASVPGASVSRAWGSGDSVPGDSGLGTGQSASSATAGDLPQWIHSSVAGTADPLDTDRPVDAAWQSDWLRNNLPQNHLAQNDVAQNEQAQNDLQRADRPGDSGRIDLRQTDLGRSDLGRSDMGQDDLGRSDLGQDDLNQGDLGLSESARSQTAGSSTAKSETLKSETPRSETTAEQTMPLRRRNSFFGDAPPVDEDPNLLPLAVAPGVFTSKDAPSQQFSDEPHPFQFPSIHEDEAPAPLRGFAGLTTPPEPTTPEPTFRSEPPAQAEVVLQSEATPSTEDRTAQPEARDREREPVDELRHTRSRRAAFGRDPGTLYTSERRRARRHVLPSDESESGYGRRSDDGNPAVGTWLQENRGQTEEPVREEGWGWAQSGDDVPPRATRRTSDPLTDPLTDGEPLPRRDKSLPTELREEGTGWIAPDVPPSELPSLVPSALVPPSADVIPLPTDRTDVLREIRDRARRGTDGTGAWAGHSGPVEIVRENEPKPTASVLEDVHKQEIEDDRQTAVVRPIRDPYEPAESFPATGTAAPGDSEDDSADTSDGGR